MEELRSYYWPGNIRQLRNLVERMMILDRDGYVEVHELPPEVTALAAPGQTFAERVAACEQQMLLSALKSCRFNLTAAAEVLGLTYDQMRYYHRKYELRRFDPGENHRADR
jgi:DNA-binding NtrC family response regulator